VNNQEKIPDVAGLKYLCKWKNNNHQLYATYNN